MRTRYTGPTIKRAGAPIIPTGSTGRILKKLAAREQDSAQTFLHLVQLDHLPVPVLLCALELEPLPSNQ